MRSEVAELLQKLGDVVYDNTLPRDLSYERVLADAIRYIKTLRDQNDKMEHQIEDIVKVLGLAD